MTGMLLTPMQQKGRMFIRFFSVLLCLLLCLNGCSSEFWVGEGRGDWKVEILPEYYIFRVNSHAIYLCHKGSEDVSYSCVIDKYFVTAYQTHTSIICLEGITTADDFASDEELKSRIVCYYLVNTSNEEVNGPFDTIEGFTEYCTEKGLNIEKEGWIKAKESG